MLRAREAVDVCQLEHHEDGEAGADPGNGHEASHPRIVPPAVDELFVEAPDLLVEQVAQRQAVFPDRGGDRREGQGVELSLPADGRPALPRGRLEVAPGQQAVRHPRPLPDQAHAVPDELPGLPHGRRGDPHRGEQVAPEKLHQPFGVHAVVLQPRGGDGPGLLRVGEDRLMPELLQHIHEPPPGAGGLDGHPGGGRDLLEEPLHPEPVVLQAMLRQLPSGAQHGNLRHSFVQVHADVYYGFGLLPQRVCALSSECPAYPMLGGKPTLL